MPARRVLISIDERLLARIDAACERKGMTRSAYLAQLAATDLAHGTGPGVDPAVGSAIQALEALFVDAAPFESTAVIRSLREPGGQAS